MKRFTPEPVVITSKKSDISSSTCYEPVEFACKYNNCGLSFTNRYNLKRHILSKHTLAKPFQCPHCKELFALRQYLLDHLSHRNKVKKSQCGILNNLLAKGEAVDVTNVAAITPGNVNVKSPKTKADKKGNKAVGGKNPHYERFRLPMFQVTRMEPEDYIVQLPEVFTLPRWVEEGQLPLPRNHVAATFSANDVDLSRRFKRHRPDLCMYR
mmetsp:Transcript_63568/g.72852  ORF Transcript_63568/g.72852 Transcript_63568/m.72852 type:complete len:211 (-) Transcript_63568:657-1289(-)|eukprot:CAMPEP_0115010808 /NCGR_PEP_ID=MMETSP0216-20121206/23561_1 /TAXON_ID=223996 /ORGANISM="Protocruzia adherens, Strain Boccale" /LENGTH=210 /DNA_ID=CAMNT_0002379143 /DNA_START=1745 /DNA_END=2377 /DNA_ORIENTATION=-